MSPDTVIEAGLDPDRTDRGSAFIGKERSIRIVGADWRIEQSER